VVGSRWHDGDGRVVPQWVNWAFGEGSRVRASCRVLLAEVLGFALGMCVGPVSVVAIHLRDVLRGGEEWPHVTSDYLIAVAALSTPAAINGAIGAGLAVRRGTRSRTPISILPAALHLLVGFATIAILKEPQSFFALQMYTLVFTAVIWSAGRLGQRIGCAFAATGSCRQSAKPSRPLTEAEGVVLTLIQEHYGPQNTADDVFFWGPGDAILFVKDSSGSSPICVNLTASGSAYADGLLTLKQLKSDWLRIPES
jgi:hypothetical protein